MAFSRSLVAFTLVALAALLAWGFLFHVSDADVWWHLKAGQTMLQSGWIHTDPFAYTRAGLPYLATHEWLFQVLLTIVHGMGGATALIVFRILTVLATGALLLLIDRKNLWPNAFFVAAGLLVSRQYFVDRPQLASNVLFALSLFLCFRLLDLPRADAKAKRWTLIGLLATTVVWANMHGGSALMTMLLLGTVFVQELFDAWRESRVNDDRKQLLTLLGWCALLFLALLATPNVHHTFTYLVLLFTDQTSALLEEWTPTPLPTYLLWIGPFWLLAGLAVLFTRYKPVALLSMLLGLGILSRLGARHEVLFVLTALAVLFYSLKHHALWRDTMTKARGRPLLSGAVTLVALALLIWMNLPYHDFFLRRGFLGFGAYNPAESAVDFLEENKVEGKIFNTYTTGGYLLYRDHKVFVDGRNVDYGYDFLQPALDARYDQATFDGLAEKYGFTVAVLERHVSDGQTDEDFVFLASHPQWALAFLDDTSAVYLKRVPEQTTFIEAHAYRVITTQMFDDGRVPESLSLEKFDLFETELKRAADEDKRGIGALVLLAKFLRQPGRLPEALTYATEAARRAPYRYEPESILATVASLEKRWKDAAAHYDRAIELSKHLSITLPYSQLATVYKNAGETEKAEKYERLAREQEIMTR